MLLVRISLPMGLNLCPLNMLIATTVPTVKDVARKAIGLSYIVICAP